MSNLVYRVEKEGDVTILILMLDNVTMHENEELKKTFADLLDKGAKNIILDLSETFFISSIVVASLVFMVKRAKEAGGDLVLCGIKDKVEEVLRVTNLDKVFNIFDNKQEAINQLTKR